MDDAQRPTGAALTHAGLTLTLWRRSRWHWPLRRRRASRGDTLCCPHPFGRR